SEEATAEETAADERRHPTPRDIQKRSHRHVVRSPARRALSTHDYTPDGPSMSVDSDSGPTNAVLGRRPKTRTTSTQATAPRARPIQGLRPKPAGTVPKTIESPPTARA